MSVSVKGTVGEISVGEMSIGEVSVEDRLKYHLMIHLSNYQTISLSDKNNYTLNN